MRESRLPGPFSSATMKAGEKRRITTVSGVIHATNWLLCAFLVCLSLMPLINATSLASRQILPAQTRPFGARSSRRYRQPLLNSRSLSPSDSNEDAIQLCSNVNKKAEPQSKNSLRTSSSKKSKSNSLHPMDAATLLYFVKVGLSGGIAGAVGSAVLYPMDAAKTLRQSSPSSYSSVFDALGCLACTKTLSNTGAVVSRTWHLQNVYRGIIPACLGAIPSSALYFGAYESMKTILTRYFPTATNNSNGDNSQFSNRLFVHAMAAMSGNILSSAIFVPKELIKQQLQFRQSGNFLGVMFEILNQKGLGGLYVGYKATLLRNIPTAVMRFSLYEEFRYRWYTQDQLRLKLSLNDNKKEKSARGGITLSPKFFLAGACAGAIASGMMTPVDVVKSRITTGTCPVDVKNCFLFVIKDEGFAGLYAGAGSRMFFSGVFSAIGFGTFEFAKGVLGVSSPPPPPKARTTAQ